MSKTTVEFLGAAAVGLFITWVVLVANNVQNSAELIAFIKYALVWIGAPPGTGKTTLVASYLEARHLPGIWYRVDSGDSELRAHCSTADLSRSAVETFCAVHGTGPNITTDSVTTVRRDRIASIGCTRILVRTSKVSSSPILRGLKWAAGMTGVRDR